MPEDDPEDTRRFGYKRCQKINQMMSEDKFYFKLSCNPVLNPAILFPLLTSSKPLQTSN
jgi:hypothetical protein